MSRDAIARLFVAVDPPADVCGELAAWTRAALGGLRALDADAQTRTAGSRVRLLGAETMHITLCFLGGRPLIELDTIAAAIEACPAERPQLHVGAPLWLPPRRPRSLALAVHDREGELQRLHASVRDALAGAIDWRLERRRFRAHVTVARLAGGGGGRAGRRRRAGPHAPDGGAGSPLPPSPQLTFAPREVVLYRSLLSPGGASYEAVATRALESSATSSKPSPSSPPSSPSAVGVGEEPDGIRHAGVESSPADVARESSSHSVDDPSAHS
ncbi:MAG TPA: RNA 2',3'-cyclic phosphodiesterase [Solirubrobacteraceae bacterium]|jgi:2'-5' RNA ligase|nr:RNA 2',3'-cyclic phosphodiesterase [Solirubrobacteraceae bacterium]